MRLHKSKRSVRLGIGIRLTRLRAVRVKVRISPHPHPSLSPPLSLHPQVDYKSACRMLKSMGEMESVGPSLGSFSVSQQLLELFLNGFKAELTSKVHHHHHHHHHHTSPHPTSPHLTSPHHTTPHLTSPEMFTTLTYDSIRPQFHSQTGKFDSDPHLWMPMTLGEKEYVELMQQKGI